MSKIPVTVYEEIKESYTVYGYMRALQSTLEQRLNGSKLEWLSGVPYLITVVNKDAI